MNYFIVRNGQQAGPFAVDQLIAEGVTPTTLVWCEGMAQWQPAQEIAEISVLFYQQPIVPPTPEQTYQQPQPAYQQPQQVYQQPQQPQQAYQQPQQAYQQPQQAYQQPAYGPQPAYGNQKPMPQNYLIHSILVTLLCCWPLGIVAIINAVGVSSAYNAGNYEEAEHKSQQAKKWCIWSAVGAAIAIVLYLVILLVIGVSEL